MKNLLYLISGLLLLSSCTKIIDIELNEGLQRIVIEGKITNQDTPVTIFVTRTTDYFNPDEPEKVSGATVSIKGPSGVYVTLPEVSPGVYQTSLLKGQTNQTYYLRVLDGEDVYEASSHMPMQVNLDSLVYEPSYFGNPRDTTVGYLLTSWFTDPADRANYYNFKLKRTPVDTLRQQGGPPGASSSAILLNDVNFNGRLGSFNLNRIGLYYVGDTVQVDFISLDQPIYQYYDQLNEISGGGVLFSSSAPANPQSNISNGAMGYFSAEAVDTKIVIIR
jgi:hypothetical protein